MHDYKNYALLLKSFLCKKMGRKDRKMYTHSYCQRCPAWDGKNQECCLLRMSKTLRGKRTTTTIMSDKNRMEIRIRIDATTQSVMFCLGG